MLGYPPFGMFALVLLTVLTMPTWTLGEVAAQGVEETNMEALITVWPYDLSTSGLVVLPEETHWAVHPNYNGGSAQGGDDRLIVVLQDPATRDGFWPVIVKMPLSERSDASSRPRSRDQREATRERNRWHGFIDRHRGLFSRPERPKSTVWRGGMEGHVPIHES